jgi:O-succinylbenzoate synthase
LKISYSSYELISRDSLNAVSKETTRKGALLKFSFTHELIGYADCHPWPELGDAALEMQLVMLTKGELTPITRSALEFARLDAKGRLDGKSSFVIGSEDQKMPCSHFLVTNIMRWTPQDVSGIMDQGYTHLKIKLGRRIEEEVKKLHELFLNTSLKLRLDFNERLTPSVFQTFLAQMEKMREQIDFIEDPFPFDPFKWSAFQDKGWTLACDRQVSAAYGRPEAARVIVFKPAVQPLEELLDRKDQTCIVTSYLGHPLGQMVAAYAATLIDPCSKNVHGLLSHHAYFPNSFSLQLNGESPLFTSPAGPGFGFHEELESLDWIDI